MSKNRDDNADKNSGSDITPLHGAVVSPKTMSMVCEGLGLIQRWQNNELEGGKGFPATTGGGKFPGFSDDVVSATPPADEHILSGGKTDARDCVNFTNEEMRKKYANFDWRTTDAVHKVKAGDQFDIKWEYAAVHKTRGYDYWITKQPVDFTHRLTREDFDDKPFQTHYNTEQPYWSYPLTPSTNTSVTLPDKDPGYYVLLERWVVADSGMAFHQSWILEYDTELAGHATDSLYS